MAGETLGDRYLLEERVGEGGMAEVFRARRLGAMGFSREVCIKRIRPALVNDRSFVEMFIDEARTTSKLRHSNIVAVDDFGQIGTDLFACMEWVPGADAAKLLAKVTRDRRYIPLDAVLHVVGAVLQALEYAHARLDAEGRPLGIVHRDVTPHNILVSYAGEVKLTDFGIAKASSRVHQTAGDLVKGKVAYMAPEQARGLDLDGRVDLFALGVVAFELLAGRRPFAGARQDQVILDLLQGARPRLRALRPALDPALEAFVDRLLETAREARFPSARAALDALAPLVPGATGMRTLAGMMAHYFPGHASAVTDASWLARAPSMDAASDAAALAPTALRESTPGPGRTAPLDLAAPPTEVSPPPLDVDPAALGPDTVVDQVPAGLGARLSDPHAPTGTAAAAPPTPPAPVLAPAPTHAPIRPFVVVLVLVLALVAGALFTAVVLKLGLIGRT